ncbi:MAG TPA: ABC transporter permease [Mycobacteriales bacterium]|nr:ABC transporter permease [Mycobacteriales bacterium]
MTATLAAGGRLTATGALTRAARVFERNVAVYRSRWFLLVSGLLEPLLYLGSIGVGFGKLVGTLPFDGRQVGYADFVAPALLATSAMNGSIVDATFGVFFKLKHMKVYDAVLATPVRATDIAVGEVAWSLARSVVYSLAFLVVAAAFGDVHSWWALLALPAATLVGLCFGGVGTAATTFMRSWQDFDLVQLAILPLFLFSATFYPLSTYPSAAQWLVQLTPLYHGVALLRQLTLGAVHWSALGHVGYLAVLGLAGVAVAGRRLERRLLK